jgi:hypothetical protein
VPREANESDLTLLLCLVARRTVLRYDVPRHRRLRSTNGVQDFPGGSASINRRHRFNLKSNLSAGLRLSVVRLL